MLHCGHSSTVADFIYISFHLHFGHFSAVFYVLLLHILHVTMIKQNCKNVNVHLTNVSTTSTFRILHSMLLMKSAGFGHVCFEHNDIFEILC